MVKKLLFIILVSSLLFTGLFGFAGGDGSVGNPYQVSNAVELDSVRHFLSSNFIQTGDIDLGVAPWNTGSGWIPVGNSVTPFTGNYNGGNYTISGLFINDNSDIKGLFGYSYGGILESVKLMSVDVTGGAYVGGLVGAIAANTAIINCTTQGIVNGLYEVGGLIGYSQSSTISDCTSASAVSGVSSAGGICGTLDDTNVISCISTSDVTTTGYHSGGLIGYMYLNSSVSNSNSSGNITGERNVGGLVGYSYGSNIKSSNADCVSNGIYYVSAFLGMSYNDSIQYSYGAGSIYGDICGGLIGRSYGTTVTNCNTDVDLNGNGFGNSGGLIGWADSTNVTNCLTSGTISDGQFVGGLVGCSMNQSVITDSYSNADVSCTIWSVGGLLGESYDSHVVNCYSIGQVTGPDYYGGLIGYKETTTITSSYWGIETSGQSVSDGGTGKSTLEMKELATFTGWDFSTPVWNMHSSVNDGYPYLTMEGRVPVETTQNVEISYSPSPDIITISWDAVAGATEYKMYSSDEPYGVYTPDINGSFYGTVWTVPLTDSKRFYKVTAINPTK